MKVRAFVFPGQGSQKVGMGADLFPIFPELTAVADAELGYSIEELCLRDPRQQLNQTEFTQPALFTVNAFSFLKRLMDTGEMPHFVAGHSLGEYNALFAAGAFDFRTGLALVKKRGALMSQARGGRMAAVIGFSREQLADVLTRSSLKTLDIANLNTPAQIVISGPENDVVAAEPILMQAGAQFFKKLNVSGAFHSRYMADSQRALREYMQSLTFGSLRFPVLSNVTARPYEPSQIKEQLAAQLTSPVRWTESVQWILNSRSVDFHEIGPGNVLTGMLKKIREQSTLATQP
jgi:trans-AT polyketide synthase/acyltransferase/oxidoreductase domain-containing protein